MEETSSGGGISHRVNGIAIQPLVYGPMPEMPALQVIPKNKERSIEPMPCHLPIYNAGNSTGPPYTIPADIDTTAAYQEAQLKKYSG